MLTQNVKDIIDISESTLYPVLRRLQQDNALTTYDQPYKGRNRSYYRITGEGKQKLDTYRIEWKDYKTKVDRILFGGMNNG